MKFMVKITSNVTKNIIEDVDQNLSLIVQNLSLTETTFTLQAEIVKRERTLKRFNNSQSALVQFFKQRNAMNKSFFGKFNLAEKFWFSCVYYKKTPQLISFINPFIEKLEN